MTINYQLCRHTNYQSVAANTRTPTNQQPNFGSQYQQVSANSKKMAASQQGRGWQVVGGDEAI